MNALDRCPDDLLARAANGPLGSAEQALLAAHLAHCETCRTVADVTASLADEASALAGDDLLVSRLAARAAGAARTPPLRLRPRLRVATALAATAAAAAGLWHFGGGRRREPAGTAELARNGDSVRTGEAAPVQTPHVTAAPTGPSALAPEASPTVEEDGPPIRTPARRSPPAVDIDRLLSQARAARAAGDLARARIAYARVVHLAPGTPQAAVAEVAIGLLLLERADASDAAAALKAFDRYLVVAPSGALREEALAGRARALELLGEGPRALAAWEELLAKYPRSLQAPLAQRRLERLRADLGHRDEGR